MNISWAGTGPQAAEGVRGAACRVELANHGLHAWPERLQRAEIWARD